MKITINCKYTLELDGDFKDMQRCHIGGMFGYLVMTVKSHKPLRGQLSASDTDDTAKFECMYSTATQLRIDFPIGAEWTIDCCDVYDEVDPSKKQQEQDELKKLTAKFWCKRTVASAIAASHEATKMEMIKARKHVTDNQCICIVNIHEKHNEKRHVQEMKLRL